MTTDANAGSVPRAIVLAIEAEAGWSPETRFASAALSAVEGQLPFHRYFGAGRRAAAIGRGADSIEASMWDWMDTCLHPLDGYLLGLDDPRSVVDCLNAHNARDLGLPWDQERQSVFAEYGEGEKTATWADRPPYWELSSGGGDFRLYACRISPNGFDDPKACQIASLATIQYAVDHAQRRADERGGEIRTLSSVARHLGAERSAAAEAAWVFEHEGVVSIEALSKRLGCQRRTLERELRAVGLTAGKLRLARMIVGATNQLHSAATLTQIAADQGFSDLAHMTRAFKASCGMAPSALRGAGAPALRAAHADFKQAEART